MEKNIVMIVHGVGEQQPGATIDSLVGAATHRLGLHGRVSGHTEFLVDSKLPTDADRIENPKPEQKSSPRQMRLFPCAIRRSDIPAGDRLSESQLKKPQEIIAAEVYWADLSAAPRGVLSIVKDLLHTVLALGYLAIDNIDDWPGQASTITRRLVRAFVAMFYYLIAPCNAVMLVGAIFLIAVDLLRADTALPFGWAFLLALILWGALAGFSFRNARKAVEKNRSFLACAFWKGSAGVSAGIFIVTILFAMTTDFRADGGEGLFDKLAQVLVGSMVIGWAAAMTLLAAMTIDGIRMWLNAHWPLSAHIVNGIANRQSGIVNWLREKRSIYISICCAMLLFWTLLAGAFWAIFAVGAKSLLGSGAAEARFSQIFDAEIARATQTLLPIMWGVAGLMFIALLVGAFRFLNKETFSQTAEPMPGDIWLGRVIVNPFVSLALFGLVIWVGYHSFIAFLVIMGLIEPTCVQAAEIQPGCIVDGNNPTNPCNPDCGTATSKVIGIAAILGALILIFRQTVAAGLGVVRDITSYSIRANSPGKVRQETQREEVERIYPIRAQMLDRFDLVLEYLLDQVKGEDGNKVRPDRLIVIAHSQGTVIAATALAQRQRLPCPTYLLTMGSPLSHIYQQYFPKGFRMPGLADRLTLWLNIFRRDDFVGTYISDKSGKVINRAVGSGGHIHYWTDNQVWDEALTTLDHYQGQKGTSSPPPIG